MPTSAYAWAVIVLVLVGFAVWIRSAIRRGASAEAQAERETEARLDAERKADEHKRVAEVERRPLPGGVAGSRVRDVPGKLGGTPPGPGRA